MEVRDKYINGLTVQVVADLLENVPDIERIVMIAHYMEGYKIDYMAKIFEMSKNEVRQEIKKANEYIMTECVDYELNNKCNLKVVNDDVIKSAFELFYKQQKMKY